MYGSSELPITRSFSLAFRPSIDRFSRWNRCRTLWSFRWCTTGSQPFERPTIGQSTRKSPDRARAYFLRRLLPSSSGWGSESMPRLSARVAYLAENGAVVTL